MLLLLFGRDPADERFFVLIEEFEISDCSFAGTIGDIEAELMEGLGGVDGEGDFLGVGTAMDGEGEAGSFWEDGGLIGGEEEVTASFERGGEIEGEEVGAGGDVWNLAEVAGDAGVLAGKVEFERGTFVREFGVFSGADGGCFFSVVFAKAFSFDGGWRCS